MGGVRVGRKNGLLNTNALPELQVLFMQEPPARCSGVSA
jgi:hypothetical protein